MSPGSFSGEIWHPVLWESVVQEFASANEFRALPAPAGVTVNATVSAAGGAIGVALGGGMSACTGTAYISWSRAVTGNMPIGLALGAADRFLLVFADNNTFLFDAKAISEEAVRRIRVRDLKEGKGFSLFRGSTSWRFDPTDGS